MSIHVVRSIDCFFIPVIAYTMSYTQTNKQTQVIRILFRWCTYLMNVSWGDLEASAGAWRWPAAVVTVGERGQLTLARRNYPPRIPSGGYLAHGIQIYEARVMAGRTNGGGRIRGRWRDSIGSTDRLRTVCLDVPLTNHRLLTVTSQFDCVWHLTLTSSPSAIT